MKVLAALTTASGLIWLAVLVTLSSGWAYPAWRLIGVTLAYLTIAALLLATAGSPARLPRRLVLLWLGALVAAYTALAGAGPDPVVFGAALLYGTVAYLIWLSIPMVIYSFIAWRPPADEPRATRSEVP
jgi:hypothetical protein